MTDQPPPHRRPFQFRLRTLFVLTAVLAIILSGLSAPSNEVRAASAAAVIIALPAILTTALVYGRGYARTFCIGCLFPAGYGVFELLVFFVGPTRYDFVQALLGRDPPSDDEVAAWLTWLMVVLLLTLAMGLLAMGVRWLVESANRADAR